MKRKVYQFGMRPPTSGADLVLEQFRAVHDYRNDLVAIERGRRAALRAVDDTPEVRAAIEALAGVRRKERVPWVKALRNARKTARAAAPEELARIQACDDEMRKSARANTRAYWGSYLDVEARHQQSRAQPLYGDDAVTPNDPRFLRWRGVEGQIGVQLQKGLSTADVYAAKDSRVRLVRRPSTSRSYVAFGALSIRVGSDGRDPVWAEFPIGLHREIPSSAAWKWVRVSCRREGHAERWTCEITVDDSAPAPRSLDRELDGGRRAFRYPPAIAIEWEWSQQDDGSIRVASWADTRGRTGPVILSDYDAQGIRKPDDIRAVRDILLNELRPRFVRAIRGSAYALPTWLVEAANTIPFWKSPSRFYSLVERWRRERCDSARTAYELLDAWWERDAHLYQYEATMRTQTLRRRRDFYRTLCAAWARRYRYVLLSDQDLSREAKWGEESDVRFTAGVSELRQCLRNAFGDDAIDAVWRDETSETDERSWCERTRDAWEAGGARGDGRFAERKEKTMNAWAARKRRAAERRVDVATAREAVGNSAE